MASDIGDSVTFASSVVDGRLRTRYLFILMHDGGESKRSGSCEINMGRPLLQEEQSAKTYGGPKGSITNQYTKKKKKFPKTQINLQKHKLISQTQINFSKHEPVCQNTNQFLETQTQWTGLLLCNYQRGPGKD